uniref:Uncharacterized protein n=1 Tax=uncultured prokaryote TaxID=198431 RepID=A0A0H5PV20_9ZZZZ|nr:hypothetical protein [uncultured prokaryote]
MPYPQHVLIQMEGLLSEFVSGDAGELWSCSVRGLGPGGAYLTDPQGFIDDIAAPLSAWFSAQATTMASSAYLGSLKVNNINADGHYADDATTYEHLYSPNVPGNAAPVAPAFCSLAFEWRTAVARGYGSHGRIFPPNFAIPTLGGSGVSAGNASALADSGVALLQVLSNPDGSEQFEPCVVSKKGGVARPITRVGVGDLYDYQSRRKNAGREVYNFKAYPPG